MSGRTYYGGRGRDRGGPRYNQPDRRPPPPSASRAASGRNRDRSRSPPRFNQNKAGDSGRHSSSNVDERYRNHNREPVSHRRDRSRSRSPYRASASTRRVSTYQSSTPNRAESSRKIKSYREDDDAMVVDKGNTTNGSAGAQPLQASAGSKITPAAESEQVSTETSIEAMLGVEAADGEDLDIAALMKSKEEKEAEEVEKRRKARRARLAAARAKDAEEAAKAPPVEPEPALPDPTTSNGVADTNGTKESDVVGADGEHDETAAGDYDPTQDEKDRLRAMVANSSAADAPITTQRVRKRRPSIDMFDTSQNIESDSSQGEETPAKQIYINGNDLANSDDSEGYYKLVRGEMIRGRYQLQAQLGKGVFANVLKAVRMDNGQLVAIKVARNNGMIEDAGRKEMRFFLEMQKYDPQYIVGCLESFNHKGHFCMTFELLDLNLRDKLRVTNMGHGFNFWPIVIYTYQFLQGLRFLKDRHIIHADLKPDNILMSADQKTVKICDFGTALYDHEALNQNATTYMVSRFYRAPDIIIGMKPTYAVDMWAIGCTIYELWTGNILFTGANNNKVLLSIQQICGPFSLSYLNKTPTMHGNMEEVAKHFENRGGQVAHFRDCNGAKVTVMPVVKPKKNLRARIFETAKELTMRPADADLKTFSDLLDDSLHLRVDRRITPEHALAKYAEFFKKAAKNTNFSLRR